MSIGIQIIEEKEGKGKRKEVPNGQSHVSIQENRVIE
jgi:hypothetical protein